MTLTRGERARTSAYDDQVDQRNGVELNVPPEHDAYHVDDDDGDEDSDYQGRVQVER